MPEDSGRLQAAYHRDRAAAEREAARRSTDLRARDVHLALARGHERAMLVARRISPANDRAAITAMIGANLRAAIGLPGAAIAVSIASGGEAKE
ncbi:hypothetical protein F1C10_05215 [Sphingomonas sp. NBWT7]|uniref:hypothetical protein n=1 Tax=Sphingomonas sp. NBWT7 TaxID=2596913 RepID=UPI001627A73D|nr:hypothetical protein [Sphingomonas sp. NBWT7]QNE31391.1 hypothetical protein F1C10_05215 [Sphingomonas sp. NBWT7]